MANLHTYRQTRAFTLPEALITVGILASVILYSILAFTVGKYATQLSKSRIIISNLLKAEMESILGSTYSTLTSSSKDIEIDNIKVRVIVDTPIVVDPDVYGYKKVHVRLEWKGGISWNKTLRDEAVMYVPRI